MMNEKGILMGIYIGAPYHHQNYILNTS
jgi:hypothetical protein